MPRFYETTLSITNLHNLSISTHVNRSRINSKSLRCFSTRSICCFKLRNSKKLTIWKPTTIVAQTPINEAIIPIYESVVIAPLFFICPQNVRATQVMLIIVQTDVSIIFCFFIILYTTRCYSPIRPIYNVWN